MTRDDADHIQIRALNTHAQFGPNCPLQKNSMFHVHTVLWPGFLNDKTPINPQLEKSC